MQTGQQLADLGGQRAVEHAERVEPKWADQACRWLRRYMVGRFEITIERAKAWAYEHGLPQPPAPGAWGPVTKRAVKAGYLTFARYETSENASQHAKPIKVWSVSDKGRNV